MLAVATTAKKTKDSGTLETKKKWDLDLYPLGPVIQNDS